MKVSSARPRSGLTLLEVLLAMTIFLLSLVAIGRLITYGTDRARDIQGRAIQLCQSKLAEIIIGDSSGGGDDPDWEYNVQQEDSGIPGLLQVTVTVKRKNAEASEPAAVLTQMVLDPSQRGSSLDPDPTLAAASSDNSGSSSSANSGTPSSGTQGSSGAASGAAPKASTPASGAAPKTSTPASSGPSKSAASSTPATTSKGGKP